MTAKVIWDVVKAAARHAGIEKLAPHDLRRTCARLCHLAGGELDQIQFLLGHVSIQTTVTVTTRHENEVDQPWRSGERFVSEFSVAGVLAGSSTIEMSAGLGLAKSIEAEMFSTSRSIFPGNGPDNRHVNVVDRLTLCSSDAAGSRRRLTRSPATSRDSRL